MSPGSTQTVRIRSALPEPGRCWVRYTLEPWPSAPGSWVDLLRGGVGRDGGADVAVPPWPGRSLDDVLYLPPVPPELGPERDALARRAVAEGAPVLVQLRPGERAPEGAVAAYDLLDSLTGERLQELDAVPPGALVLWPLIGGLTEAEELWAAGLERLAAAGAGAVLGLAPGLTPRDRRRLVEGHGEALFHRLFHQPPPSEQRFARAVRGRSLAPFPDRPLPPGPARLRRNRLLASRLFLAAELWLRLERPESDAQALYRAARELDRSEHDFVALIREGNLDIVDWIDRRGADLLTQVAATGSSTLLRELEDEYLGRPG